MDAREILWKKPNRKFPKINTCVLFRFVFSSTKFSDIFFVLDTLNLFTFCSFVFMSFNKDLVFVIVTPVFWIFTKKSTVFFFFFVFLRFAFFFSLILFQCIHTYTHTYVFELLVLFSFGYFALFFFFVFILSTLTPFVFFASYSIRGRTKFK